MTPGLQAFNAACHNLSMFVLAEAQSIMNQYGVSMRAAPNAPDNYPDLLREWRECSGTRIVVSSLNCANTIYTTPEVNHLFRFWHDWLHLEHDKPFTLAGELFIGAIHCDAVASFYGEGSMEHKLMIADTIGQSTYEALTGAFPKNQRAFAWGFVHQ